VLLARDVLRYGRGFAIAVYAEARGHRIIFRNPHNL
jgi:hypothetical protein